MSPERAPRTHSWRDVLKGKYKPDAKEKARYHYDMRETAKGIMEDLKTILDNASASDLYQIFNKDEEQWQKVMFPVASKLLTVVGPHLSPERATEWKLLEKRGWYPLIIETLLGSDKNPGLFADYGMRFNAARLFNEEDYRRRKMKMLKKKIQRNPFKLTEEKKTLLEQQVSDLEKVLSNRARQL